MVSVAIVDAYKQRFGGGPGAELTDATAETLCRASNDVLLRLGRTAI
jgi:hypothetical protein